MKKTSVQKNKQELDSVTSTLTVMELFFKYPSVEFSLSEVAEKTGLSKGTVSKIIKNLKEGGFVTVVDLDIVYRIRAARENWMYQREKIVRNFASIVRSNIVEFLVKEFNNPKCIILFGSFRKGEDDEDSDIDLAVEVNTGVETGTFEYDEFKEIEKLLNRKITVHVYDRKKIKANVFTAIANGIVLYGLLEVSK
jgi:predicted nucleotidyltransferase/biotin operon repressor